MAITETRNLPAPFIQKLGEYYGAELPALTKDKMDVAQWAPTVAGHSKNWRYWISYIGSKTQGMVVNSKA